MSWSTVSEWVGLLCFWAFEGSTVHLDFHCPKTRTNLSPNHTIQKQRHSMLSVMTSQDWSSQALVFPYCPLPYCIMGATRLFMPYMVFPLKLSVCIYRGFNQVTGAHSAFIALKANTLFLDTTEIWVRLGSS